MSVYRKSARLTELNRSSERGSSGSGVQVALPTQCGNIIAVLRQWEVTSSCHTNRHSVGSKLHSRIRCSPRLHCYSVIRGNLVDQVLILFRNRAGLDFQRYGVPQGYTGPLMFSAPLFAQSLIRTIWLEPAGGNFKSKDANQTPQTYLTLLDVYNKYIIPNEMTRRDNKVLLRLGIGMRGTRENRTVNCSESNEEIVNVTSVLTELKHRSASNVGHL